MRVVFSGRQRTIERDKTPLNQALLDFTGLPWNAIWSGRWESNPRLKLGKLGYYHYTTPAPLLDSSRLLEDQATSTDRGQIRRSHGVPGDSGLAVESGAVGWR